MSYPARPPRRRRPIGVLILGILVILSGVFVLLISLLGTLLGVLGSIGSGGDPLFVILLVVGLVGVLFGILLMVAGTGLLGLRPWAWWLATIVLVLWIANSLLGSYSLAGTITLMALWPVVIPILILVYLLVVRRHFTSRPYAV